MIRFFPRFGMQSLTIPPVSYEPKSKSIINENDWIVMLLS
jgi:hypothetical protein